MKPLMAICIVFLLAEYALRAQTVHGIQFSWKEATPNVTFNLYCATVNNGQVHGSPQVKLIPASPYLWTAGTPGTIYFCKVTAVEPSTGVESGFSNQAVQTFPPKAPTGVTGVQQ